MKKMFLLMLMMTGSAFGDLPVEDYDLFMGHLDSILGQETSCGVFALQTEGSCHRLYLEEEPQATFFQICPGMHGVHVTQETDIRTRRYVFSLPGFVGWSHLSLSFSLESEKPVSVSTYTTLPNRRVLLPVNCDLY